MRMMERNQADPALPDAERDKSMRDMLREISRREKSLSRGSLIILDYPGARMTLNRDCPFLRALARSPRENADTVRVSPLYYRIHLLLPR